MPLLLISKLLLLRLIIIFPRYSRKFHTSKLTVSSDSQQHQQHGKVSVDWLPKLIRNSSFPKKMAKFSIVVAVVCKCGAQRDEEEFLI